MVDIKPQKEAKPFSTSEMKGVHTNKSPILEALDKLKEYFMCFKSFILLLSPTFFIQLFIQLVTFL